MTAFDITMEPSGRQFTAEGDETVLAAGIRHGVNLPYGCKDGACGSCKCKKLSGEVAHGPHQSKALSAEEETQGWVLTCCATPRSALVLESRQVTAQGAWPIKKMPTRLISLTRKGSDVMVLRLQLPAHEPLGYFAGQYVEFMLAGGLRRSYSMANAPHRVAQEGLELHIRHMPGGKFTDHVFATMKEREILRIEGPYGGFYLRDDSAKPVILLASGTGFAPIKAMLEHMQHHGNTRPATLYWGGRRPADLYLMDWLQEQQATMPWLRVVPVISNAQPEDGWTGRTGFVHQAVLQDAPDWANVQVYACGAPVVVESARRDYMAAGLPEHEFFADAFTSEADKAA
jgi:CDP-4-dehydro-6-deoxyglucose reductase